MFIRMGRRLLSLLALTCLAVASSNGQIPDVINTDSDPDPEWEALSVFEGDFSDPVLEESFRLYFEAIATEGCVNLITDRHEQLATGFSNAIEQAEWIFEAQVVDRSPGFLSRDVLGTLLLLEPHPRPIKAGRMKRGEEVRGRPVKTVPPQLLYLYPAVQTTFRGKGFCATDPAFPDLPEVGETILVLTADAPTAQGYWLLTNHDVVFVDRATDDANSRSRFFRNEGTPEESYGALRSRIVAQLRANR